MAKNKPKHKEHAVITINKNIPYYDNINKGSKGTIIHIYNSKNTYQPVYVVEFNTTTIIDVNQNDII